MSPELCDVAVEKKLHAGLLKGEEALEKFQVRRVSAKQRGVSSADFGRPICRSVAPLGSGLGCGPENCIDGVFTILR